MSGVLVRCPAKVNLGLRVVGDRADGFHEIVTLFQAIDLWDELAIDPAPELSLHVLGAGVTAGEDNLVWRAARLLQERLPAAAGRGARLRLTKRIPVGGGLGGGSSDAAGTLAGLDALWGLGLAAGALRELGAELGSDVPFFSVGGTALGTGRGEVITSLPSIAERPLILGTPPFPLATAAVYRALPPTLTPAGAGVTVSRLFVKFAERNDFALATNDLDAPAFSIRQELVAFRDALLGVGAEAALVSGSGSTVFGVFGLGRDVASMASTLRRSFPDWTVRESRTVASGVRVIGSKPAAS